jgi:hypothetical protein
VGCVWWCTTESHHSPVHDYHVGIRDSDHPITRGMLPFLARADELYAVLECRLPSEYHVLARGWGEHSLYVAKPRIPCQPAPRETSR